MTRSRLDLAFGYAFLAVAMASQVALAGDVDGDGIDDRIDVCCNTPTGIAVDPQGRPWGDADGDCDFDLFDWSIAELSFTGPMTPCTPEVCDGLDNDCNCIVDDLGSQSCGVGECLRVVDICSDGVPITCTPGDPVAEVCDGLDNNCDGLIDDGFLSIVTGKYEADNACDDCDTDCTDIYDVPNAYGFCDVASATVCAMLCCSVGDSHPACDGIYDYVDVNGSPCDGCELQLDPDAIYVSADDPYANDQSGCGRGPAGTGSGHRPCLTIGKGIAEAASSGRSKVLVADGTYSESVTMASGISLLGGYRADTWERNASTTRSIIFGSDTSLHKQTITASTITTPTSLDGFVIYGQNNTNARGNSYAVYITNSNANLEITNNIIFAGMGGPGSDGTSGTDGQEGVDGQGRNSTGVDPADYDAFVATGSGYCNASNNRQHTNGGVLSCGTDDISGGDGGGNQCAPSNSGEEISGTDGWDGQPGSGAGGQSGDGGDAGNDGRIVGTECNAPDDPMTGQDGTNGTRGVNGNSGLVCSTPSGLVSGGHWVGGNGGNAQNGTNGGGGGGGGAGGGGYCASCSENKDRLGAHGGGGGSGGGAGDAGLGGTSGGGSFGIFVYAGAAPTINNNTLRIGNGGPGGNGGDGGIGGEGGSGGAGGLCPGDCFCYGEAGDGGDGGDGGHGGGGGGGCGGVAFGIYTSGVGSPNYCSPEANNTFNGGAGGQGGTGGQSFGNQGYPGMSGSLSDCSFR